MNKLRNGLWFFFSCLCLVVIEGDKNANVCQKKGGVKETPTSLEFKTSGMLSMKDSDLGFTLFVTVHNAAEYYIQVMTRPVQCCEIITPSVTDCKSIMMMGGFMGTMRPGSTTNATWTYPTLYEYNRRGECVLDLWWKDTKNRTDTERFTIPFDTYAFGEIPLYMREYTRSRSLLHKRCESPDMDVLDQCRPVDCHKKYNGQKNFFSVTELLCVPSPTCYSDPDKELPDIAYSPTSNLCTDLESPIGEEDMGFLLRPTVNMDVFEPFTNKKRDSDQFLTLRCHHGKLDKYKISCDCEPGWTSAPMPEDFTPMGTIHTHMCTIFSETDLYDQYFQFVRNFVSVWHTNCFTLLKAAIVATLIWFLLCCWLGWCERRMYPDKPKRLRVSVKGVCKDYEDDDDEGSDIITSDDEWTTEDDQYMNEIGSEDSFGKRCVTWGQSSKRKSSRNSWSPTITGELETKSCLRSTAGSTAYLALTSSREEESVQGSSSSSKNVLFENHFKALILLQARRNPSPEAREHLDWIMENCPAYQHRLVLKLLKSFGADIDDQGNLRGFSQSESSAVARPKIVLRNRIKARKGKRFVTKIRKMKSTVRRCREAYTDKDGLMTADDFSTGDAPSEDLAMSRSEVTLVIRCRDEPDGEADIEPHDTIIPHYSNILSSVIPECFPSAFGPPATVVTSQPTQQQDDEGGSTIPAIAASNSCLVVRNGVLQAVSPDNVSSLLKTAASMQLSALRSTSPKMTLDLSRYCRKLSRLEMMRRTYTEFIEEIPRPLSQTTEVCTVMELAHKRITHRAIAVLTLLHQRYQGILLNKNKWELCGVVSKMKYIPLKEEKAYMKFFMNLVHFLFLLSCKRETINRIMITFGCSKHRISEGLNPHVCLFLCYLRPVLSKFSKLIDVERILMEYFMLEYPQHISSRFLCNLRKTTKFRICLYLYLYKIFDMITNREGVAKGHRSTFLAYITELEVDLARFFKDMQTLRGLHEGVKPTYVLVGAMLSILKLLHYFMVQSLYKMCLIHVDES